MSLDTLGDRRHIIDEIAENGHVTMVIGRVDTGKSTFCRQLASAAIGKGRKVGVVDSDIGQSWIGPPTTVGMKMLSGLQYPMLFPDSFYFVGNVSPEGHLLQTAIGAKLMVEEAQSLGAELVIIDTTGLVDGNIGRALKLSKIDLIKPDHIVCFQRDSELEALIKWIESGLCKVCRLKPSRFVEKKSQNQRFKYRLEQFRDYFSDAVPQELSFLQVFGQREIFLNGRMANDKEIDNISEIIGSGVLYAEWFFKGLLIVLIDSLDPMKARQLCSQLRIDELIVKKPEDFEDLLVALIDKDNKPISLGIIENIDFMNKKIVVKCKKDSVLDALKIQISRFRIPDVRDL